MSTLQTIATKINSAQNVALFCHINPDNDCFGSMFSLNTILSTLGKRVDMYSHDPMTKKDKILFTEEVHTDGFRAKNYDLVISVDSSTGDRLGKFCDEFVKHPNSIKIDHHSFGADFAKINYVDIRSSCCEIILELAKVLEYNIDKKVATYLYAGLVSDTGSFSNSGTKLDSFRSALTLCEAGADKNKVNDLQNYQSLESLKMKKFLYENFKLYQEGRIALLTVTNRQLKWRGAKKSDCEGFTEILRDIEGVKLSCVIIEKEPHEYACSFRCTSEYNVAEVAKTFGGGGHIPAAGCTLKSKNIKIVRKMILHELIKALNKNAI